MMLHDTASGDTDGDPIPGPGTPRNDGDGVAPADDDALAAAAPVAADDGDGGGGGGDDGDGGNGNGGDDDGDAPDEEELAAQAFPIPDDDPAPDVALATVTQQLALAEAMRPILAATEELYSPEKQKDRDKILADYRKAIADDGDLRVKFEAADEAFVRTAEDMDDDFDDWLDRVSGPGGVLAAAVGDRQQILARLLGTRGAREADRLAGQRAAKRWEAQFAAWKNPVANLTALVTDPAKIEALNADINNDKKPDLARFAFWFEIAPRHLQIRDEPLEGAVARQVRRLRRKLWSAPDIAGLFRLGRDRDDGSLYLADPDRLETIRREVLADWNAAAARQADAEAAFKLRPDDAASLGARWDKLKDDGWLKDARARFEAAGA